MSLETLNFLHPCFPCLYLLFFIFFFFVGCPFSFLNNSVPFSQIWFFLIAFSQIWVPNASGICLFTFLVCSPILLHQFFSHQGGRKSNHTVFLQPFVTAMMTSQLFAQIVTWWMGFCCGFFSILLIFNGNSDVYVHIHRRLYYFKATLLCTLQYNILSKRFRITWSETKRKLPRSFVSSKLQHEYKQIKFTKASSFQPPSTQENCFNDILYLFSGKVY